MRQHLLALLLLASAAESSSPSGRRKTGPRGLDPVRPLPTPGPHAVACPRCGASVGVRCNPKTLGAHRYHRARVDLAEQTKAVG